MALCQKEFPTKRKPFPHYVVTEAFLIDYDLHEINFSLSPLLWHRLDGVLL